MLVIIASVFTAFSVVRGSFYKKYAKQGDVSGFSSLVYNGKDAADPAGFTDLQINAPGYTKVAENEYLCLFSKDDYKGIKLYDKRGKKIWSGVVDNEQTLNSNIAEGIKNKMKSMLVFNYVDLIGASATEKETCSETEPCVVTTEIIKNGIRYLYNFEKLNIKLSVEMVIQGSDFLVTVPSDKIIENENGTDRMAAVKKELGQKVNQIKGYCNEVEDYSNKSSEFDDSLKQLIKLYVTSITEDMMKINEQLGSGDIDTEKLNEANDYVTNIISFIGEEKGLQNKLEQMKKLVEYVTEKSVELVKNRTTGITKLQVMPYFGSQNSKTNGYAFYPDKNGAISYFNKFHSTTAGSYYQDVYDAFLQVVPMSATLEEFKTDYISPTLMPVFGVKSGDNAFLAILTSGDTDAAIGYNPALPDLDCANVYSAFYLRKKTTLVNSGGAQSELYDNIRTKNDWQITFRMLAGDKADYSGMAEAYRSYLEQTGRLKKSELLGKKMPLSLQFFMGVRSSQKSVIPKYITMTHYSYIQKYVDDLQKNGVKNILTSIEGWTENNGVKYPDSLNSATQIGGNSGLKKLADYFKKNNFNLSLAINSVVANRKDLNSTLIDLATVKNKNQLTIEYYGTHIMNPGYIYNNTLMESLKSIKSLGVNGVNYYDIGSNLYFDYNKNAAANRKDTAYTFKNLALNTHKEIPTVVTENANAYLFSGIDWNMYVPSKDNEFLFSDENIPFLQMVLHGYIVYTGNGDNYQYNKEYQTLKNIEYGYLPFYYLTENEPFEIRKEKGYDYFYATVAKNWESTIIETYKQYEKDFGDIWNKKIINHKKLNENVSLTTYENGVKVYVNYSDKSQIIDNVKVESMSYYVAR